MRIYGRYLAATLLACAAVLFLFGAAGAHRRQSDVNAQCVSNAQKVGIGIAEYVQDWDEDFPPMQTAAAMQTAVLPYVRDSNAFICPATSLPYKPNAKLSYLSLSHFKDNSTVAVLRDAEPHADGKSTVGYLDGHIMRGGVDQADPNNECVSNAKRLTIALMLYAQDYDGYLPPMKTSTQFQNATFPYIQGSRIYLCPATHLHYKFNAALSGTYLYSYPDPASVEVLHDAQPHADGLSTHAYLDGSVVRR